MAETHTVEIKSSAPMPWSEFASCAAWLSLTAKQKAWTVAMLATGDSVLSTRLSYDCASVRQAEIMAREIRNMPAIRRAMAVISRQPIPTVEPEPERIRNRLIAAVRKHLRAAEPGSVAAAKFAAQLERLLLGVKTGRRVLDESETEDELKSQIPKGATAWYDKTTGVVIGYRTADGKDVQL
jgi:hypothetical protein